MKDNGANDTNVGNFRLLESILKHVPVSGGEMTSARSEDVGDYEFIIKDRMIMK